MEENKLDEEILAEAVRKWPFLYDKRDKRHQNRDARQGNIFFNSPLQNKAVRDTTQTAKIVPMPGIEPGLSG